MNYIYIIDFISILTYCSVLIYQFISFFVSHTFLKIFFFNEWKSTGNWRTLDLRFNIFSSKLWQWYVAETFQTIIKSATQQQKQITEVGHNGNERWKLSNYEVHECQKYVQVLTDYVLWSFVKTFPHVYLIFNNSLVALLITVMSM